jgi:post-segregation antitoxin (ccd killing protein)
MKAKVSVTVDPDLGRKAKSQGVNLSKTLNEALEEKVE